MKSTLGDETKLNLKLYKPMTGGGQMSTFDGNTQFTANVTCPSSQQFLEIFIQPSGTGDIAYMSITQDTNMDGNLDSYYPVYGISGVCANGYISCAPGTWTNCQYYKWIADSYGRISREQASLANLESCYCINSSCGSSLVWTNINQVLEDLGGGVVGALHLTNPQTAVSGTGYVHYTYGTSITYYGQKEGSCITQPGGTGTSSPQQFYNNPYSISDAVQAEVSNGAATPDSMYNLIYNAASTQGNLQTCTIAVGGQVIRENTSVDGNGSGSICNDHHLYLANEVLTEADGNKHVLLLLYDTGPGGEPHNNCGNGLYPNYYSGWHIIGDVDIPDTMEVDRVYFCVNASGGGCSGVQNICTQFPGQSGYLIECGASGAQTVNFTYTYSIQGINEYYNEGTQDNCYSLASNPDCRLKREEVDGVVTVNNFSPTGLQPLPSCRTFATSTDPIEVCHDWWLKERTYMCDSTAPQYDFSDAQARMNRIVTSVTDYGSYMTYQDQRLVNGTWVSSTNTSPLISPRDSYSDCQMTCKVSKLTENTQVSQTGNATDYQINNYTGDYYYKECVPYGSWYQCPLGSGEMIVSGCTCINEFNQAAVGMQMIRLAGQDLICSDGTPKPIK
ncbi:MAG: hypothetical protein D6726_09075 [Nitrospirae bacterium]|nr:MAG: hypothetical protein D6726_09075 [Nitrospirota bacterium]